jgi:hypothetical protein
MARFAVFAVWSVDDGKVPRGGEVLRRAAIRGLRFSYYDGVRLTVLADARADSAADAIALVVGRVAIGWQALGGAAALGAPEFSQAQLASGLPGVPAGIGPRSRPDLRGLLGGRSVPRGSGRNEPLIMVDDRLGLVERSDLDGWDDDEPDDGGLAGVREPRRPRPGPGPGPGHLAAEAPLPQPPAARAG